MRRLALFFVVAAMMAALVSSQTATQGFDLQQMLPLYAISRGDMGSRLLTMLMYSLYSGGGSGGMFSNPWSWMFFPRLMGNT